MCVCVCRVWCRPPFLECSLLYFQPKQKKGRRRSFRRRRRTVLIFFDFLFEKVREIFFFVSRLKTAKKSSQCVSNKYFLLPTNGTFSTILATNIKRHALKKKHHNTRTTNNGKERETKERKVFVTKRKNAPASESDLRGIVVGDEELWWLWRLWL